MICTYFEGKFETWEYHGIENPAEECSQLCRILIKNGFKAFFEPKSQSSYLIHYPVNERARLEKVLLDTLNLKIPLLPEEKVKLEKSKEVKKKWFQF